MKLCFAIVSICVVLVVGIDTKLSIPRGLPPRKLLTEDIAPDVDSADPFCKVEYRAMESVDCQTRDGQFSSIYPAKFHIPVCSLRSARKLRRDVGNGKTVQLTCLPRTVRFVNAVTWTDDKSWKNVSCAIPFDCSPRFIYEPSVLKLHTERLRKALQESARRAWKKER